MSASATRVCDDTVNEIKPRDNWKNGPEPVNIGKSWPTKAANPTADAAMAPENPATNDVQPVKNPTVGPKASRR